MMGVHGEAEREREREREKGAKVPILFKITSPYFLYLGLTSENVHHLPIVPAFNWRPSLQLMTFWETFHIPTITVMK
jgi:hypothetical protein